MWCFLHMKSFVVCTNLTCINVFLNFYYVYLMSFAHFDYLILRDSQGWYSHYWCSDVDFVASLDMLGKSPGSCDIVAHVRVGAATYFSCLYRFEATPFFYTGYCIQNQCCIMDVLFHYWFQTSILMLIHTHPPGCHHCSCIDGLTNVFGSYLQVMFGMNSGGAWWATRAW